MLFYILQDLRLDCKFIHVNFTSNTVLCFVHWHAFNILERKNISIDVGYNGRILDTGNIDPDIFYAIFPEFKLPGSKRFLIHWFVPKKGL